MERVTCSYNLYIKLARIYARVTMFIVRLWMELLLLENMFIERAAILPPRGTHWSWSWNENGESCAHL